MKLTVVTATYNCIRSGNGDKLVRCIDSVAKLKTPHEHLIYDGASNDGTIDLLKRQIAKHPNLFVISEKDKGIYNALNKGVRDASGEWFYVIGADDFIFAPDAMDRIIDECGWYDMIHSPVRRTNGTVMFQSASIMRYMFLWNCFPHQGTLARTEVMRKFNGFDESNKVSADYNFFFEAHLSGIKIKYDFRIYAVYEVGGISYDPNLCKKYDYMVIGRHLKVSEKQYLKMSSASLPIMKLCHFINHRDLAIKTAARYMLRKRFQWLAFGFLRDFKSFNRARTLYRRLMKHGEFSEK